MPRSLNCPASWQTSISGWTCSMLQETAGPRHERCSPRSFRHLDQRAAAAFQLAALHPGTDFDTYAFATMTSLQRSARGPEGAAARPRPPDSARRTVAEYGMHDLLRVPMAGS